MELDILHILGYGLRAVAHSYAVARRHQRIGRGIVYIAATARSYDREFRQHGLDFVGIEVEDICSEAGQTARMARNYLTQMVLRKQVYGEVVFENGDVLVGTHLLDKRPFDLGTRQVAVMQYAVRRVATLAMKIEPPVGSSVEIDAPAYKVFGRFGSPPHYELDGRTVAFACSAYERVLDMFFECVGQIRNRTDAALRIVGIAFDEFAFGY